MIEPMTMGGARVTLAGASIGFPAGGAPKVLGRMVAVRGGERVLRVRAA